MKKIIFTFLFLIATLSVNAIEIKFRYLIEPEKLSIMTTQYRVESLGQRDLLFALQYEGSLDESKDHFYFLHVYFETNDSDIYIPQRGRLLIRTTKDEVISLEDCGESSFTEYRSESCSSYLEQRSVTFLDPQFGLKYRSHGKYPISKEDLQKLVSDGVIKIRIETTADLVQCEYKAEKNNRIATVLGKLYNLLVSNINPYYGL